MTEQRKGWHVIIVEDEPSLANIIQDYLTQAGMTSDILNEGDRAVEIILDRQPDLVVLDVMLPGKDGLTICREVRAVSDVPIILETARVEELDRLLGLELGADDYVCKPFSPRELVARVKAILRRQDKMLKQQLMGDNVPEPRFRFADAGRGSLDRDVRRQGSFSDTA